MPDDTTRNGDPVWYGGGKLAPDLSWPKLQQRWTRAARPDSPLTPGEADALWEYAARTVADATARIRFFTATGNPAAAADAASAASDMLHTAAAALGSRTLRRAADDYDRAARQPYGRIPAPTPAGNQLRHAARLISAYAARLPRSRSGTEPGEILVPHRPGSSRPGRGHHRGNHEPRGA